jgi:hypothetical protein
MPDLPSAMSSSTPQPLQDYVVPYFAEVQEQVLEDPRRLAIEIRRL